MKCSLVRLLEFHVFFGWLVGRDRVTERLGQTVMNLVAENVSLSERVAGLEAASSSETRKDKMVRLGGKKYAQPPNRQEVYERARKDVKNMKDDPQEDEESCSLQVSSTTTLLTD